MPPARTSDHKVSVSFTNWVLGGSLISLTSTDSDSRRRRSLGRRVIVTEVDSEVENSKKPKARAGEDEAKKDEKKEDVEQVKNGDERNKKSSESGKERSKEKKKCKSCGRVSTEDGEKNEGEDKAKKDGCNSDQNSEQRSDDSKEKSDNRGSDGWTSEQDSKLKKMKQSDKSWKEIAAEVGHHQGDCKKRWKELQKMGETTSGGYGATEYRGGEFETNGSGLENGWGDERGNDDGGLSFGDLFIDKPAENSEEQNNNNKKHNNGGNKQKGGDIDKANYGGIGNQYQAGDAGWSYMSNEPLKQSQQPQRRLQANDVWSKDDCEVLEILEANYRENKWLHVQAGFFNWTGRMIAAELIESKFREDGAL